MSKKNRQNSKKVNHRFHESRDKLSFKLRLNGDNALPGRVQIINGEK